MRRLAKASSARAAICALAGAAVFAIPGTATAAPCANEAIRGEQGTQFLTGCRAYEVVSPQRKGGIDVSGDKTKGFAQVAADGNGIVYSSLGTFPGGRSAGRPNFYRAQRDGFGWSNDSLLPPFDATIAVAGEGFGLTALLQTSNADLSRSIVATNEQLTPNAEGGLLGLYRQDNPGANYLNLSPNAAPASTAFISSTAPVRFSAASKDLEHVVWTSALSLTPDAPDYTATPEADYNLYSSVGGEISLVSYLPGEVPVNSTFSQPRASNFSFQGVYQNAVSEDGSRIFWETMSSPYLRKDGSETILLPGRFGAADPTGSRAVLIENIGLVMYDVDSGTTEEIVDKGQLIVASENLEYVFFTSPEELVPGQPIPAGEPPERVGLGVYVWHDGEIALIGKGVFRNGDLLNTVAGRLHNLNDVLAARSADGRGFAFVTDAELDGFDTNGNSQIYLYDTLAATLTCASCTPEGDPSSNAQLMLAQDPGSYAYYDAIASRNNVSADGAKVFFQTASSLVPRDLNGRIDTYVYEDGAPRLVSSGKGQYDARFVAASPSGSDVFFATANRLVGSDRDDLVDLYDARVGGGFSEALPPPPPCIDSGCQLPPAGPPAAQPPASKALVGPPNPKAKRKHKQVQKKGKGKKQHAKQKQGKKGSGKRSAKANKQGGAK